MAASEKKLIEVFKKNQDVCLDHNKYDLNIQTNMCLFIILFIINKK